MIPALAFTSIVLVVAVAYHLGAFHRWHTGKFHPRCLGCWRGLTR